MNNNALTRQTIRKKYSAQFKDQALERAAKDGIPLVQDDVPHAFCINKRLL